MYGSQSHSVAAAANNNNLQLIVYYEVILTERKEMKRKFDNFAINQMAYNKEIN